MSEEKCEFCKGDFSRDTVKKYDSWDVQLFEDQSYLGRLLIKLNRHAEDMVEMTGEERRELFEEVLPEIKKGLNNIFAPDLYNYASLGNDCRHLHVHVIPRYRSERIFEGETFSDQNWNHHYKKDSSEEFSRQLLDKIREGLKEEIKS